MFILNECLPLITQHASAVCQIESIDALHCPLKRREK